MVVAIIVYELSVVGRVDGKVDHFIQNKQSIVFIILLRSKPLNICTVCFFEGNVRGLKSQPYQTIY